MVHADASNFSVGLSKKEAYEQVYDQAKALFEGQRNWVCNTANTASLLWHALHALPSPSSQVNWSGFYVLCPTAPSPTQSHQASSPADTSRHSESKQLILGPFQGKVACQTILFGRGVCGVAAATKVTQLVHDVDTFPGHIACDGESASEIVVPVIKDGVVVAIIDIDCAVKNGFDDEDKVALEKLAVLLAESCDF